VLICAYTCTPYNFAGDNSMGSLKSLLHEIILMKNFHHPNVLNILGVGFDTDSEGGRPFIILPFMVNGDLKTFLKNKRQKAKIVDHLPQVGVVSN